MKKGAITYQKPGMWGSLTDGQRKTISNIAIGLGISLIAAVAIYFGRKAYHNITANFEASKSLGGDKYATWAKQIKNAFDNNGWYGTDEVLLRRVIREIPSKTDLKKVAKSYSKLFKGANLVTDMTEELKQTEYEEMLAIIDAKPEKAKDGAKPIYSPSSWARRINAAISYNWLGLFWGTDEDAIKAVFMEMPTQKAYWDTKKAYQNKYGADMYQELKEDMDDLHTYLKIIWRKPKI